jgi:hypothetical protein
MTIQYGLTMDNQQAIIDKAKSKKDGVYKFRGVAYRVVNNHARFFASNCEVIEMCYGFNAIIGSYEHSLDSINAVKALKSIDIG